MVPLMGAPSLSFALHQMFILCVYKEHLLRITDYFFFLQPVSMRTDNVYPGPKGTNVLSIQVTCICTASVLAESAAKWVSIRNGEEEICMHGHPPGHV